MSKCIKQKSVLHLFQIKYDTTVLEIRKKNKKYCPLENKKVFYTKTITISYVIASSYSNNLI